MRIKIFGEEFGEVHTNTLARHHLGDKLTFTMSLALKTSGRQLALYEVPLHVNRVSVLAALR